MADEIEVTRQLTRVASALAIILIFIVGPVMWTVRRVLLPVDRAASERDLPFRFSMGDFLCLFWVVQLPLAFVYRIAGDETDQFYWSLTLCVWAVAPLAWYTVARALSKAGIAAGLHRMIFLGLVLPAVYYGLFPFIAMSIGGSLRLIGQEFSFSSQNLSLAVLWCMLGIALVACGFYSPWMVRHAVTKIDEEC